MVLAETLLRQGEEALGLQALLPKKVGQLALLLSLMVGNIIPPLQQ
jgi:hypothetical protein